MEGQRCRRMCAFVAGRGGGGGGGGGEEVREFGSSTGVVRDAVNCFEEMKCMLFL